MSADIFQSTLPIQGETLSSHQINHQAVISIHSPYTGRDLEIHRCYLWHPTFQSTLPIQGETLSQKHFNDICYISIHSPYTGRDLADSLESRRGSISIHSPYTGRDDSKCLWMWNWRISIHSPYTGRDECKGHWVFTASAFQSTLPIQGETNGILMADE